MTEKTPANGGPSMTRREFLKTLGGAVAGLALGTQEGCERTPEEPQESRVSPPEQLPERPENRESPPSEEPRESRSAEQEKLEKLIQESYREDYAERFPVLYGDRLYADSELLDSNFSPTTSSEYFRLTPKVRLMQYFLRNGREETFGAAERLGCEYQETLLDESHPLTGLFAEAGINIMNERVSWVAVPDGRSGGMYRDSARYGGETETMMTVEAYSEEADEWILQPARDAGYTIDTRQEFEGTVANEITHEIHDRYFRNLFPENDYERLDEPFRSFTTEVPGLRFVNDAQAGEFLSDVSNWIVGGRNGVYFRFFNPLYYMNPNAEIYRISKTSAEDDRYWYSYQVQRYAMERVLEQKGYENPSAIVDSLIQESGNLDYEKRAELFELARRYFNEDDFEEIAQIYRRIGVDLLRQMAPYYSNSEN